MWTVDSTLERCARGTVCVGEWVLFADVGMYVGYYVFDIRMYVGSEQRVVVVWLYGDEVRW